MRAPIAAVGGDTFKKQAEFGFIMLVFPPGDGAEGYVGIDQSFVDGFGKRPQRKVAVFAVFLGDLICFHSSLVRSIYDAEIYYSVMDVTPCNGLCQG